MTSDSAGPRDPQNPSGDESLSHVENLSHVESFSHVESLAQSATYTFHKQPVARARFLEGMGLEGDVHSGRTVKHRSRVAADPSQPNLRQVHLIHGELLDELQEAGYSVGPGRLGENVLTRGVDLLGLSTGTHLRLGNEVVVEVTGLRNPCVQLESIGPNLLKRLAYRDDQGTLIRRAGVMATVVKAGEVNQGDEIQVDVPDGPHRPLQKV